jgi:hypothetical protein
VKIDLDIDSKAMERRLQKISMQIPGNVKKALNVTAMYAENYLLNRTEEGRGYRGAFEPYSSSYAKFRKKKGRQAVFVDFNYSGRMLASISHTTKKDEAVIRFNRATEAKKAAMLNMQRPWFGFNNPEQKRIRRFFYRSFLTKAVVR